MGHLQLCVCCQAKLGRKTTLYALFLPTAAASLLVIEIQIYIYRVSQEECARLREGVPYVKVYRYNTKHLCPNLNG